MAGRVTLEELDIEEQLFHALLETSVEKSEDLLSRVTNVDFNNASGRTPLHVAVRIGKADWAERFLRLAASLSIEDKSGRTALQSAKEMCTKYPDSSDRMVILRMIQVADDREKLMDARAEDGNVVSLSSLLNEMSCAMDSSLRSIVTRLDEVSSKIGCKAAGGGSSDSFLLVSLLSRMSQDMSAFRRSVSAQLDVISSKAGLMQPGVDRKGLQVDAGMVEGVFSSPDAGRELIGFREGYGEKVASSLCRLSEDFSSFRASGSAQLGEILQKVDVLSDLVAELSMGVEVVTEQDQNSTVDPSSPQESMRMTNSVSADVLPGVTDTCAALNHRKTETKTTYASAVESTRQNSPVGDVKKPSVAETVGGDFRVEVLAEEMMKRTTLFGDNPEKVSNARQCYKKLLKLSNDTTSILLYMLFRTDAKVFIDCNRSHVGEMVFGLKNLDGIEDDCRKYSLIVDFDNQYVYLGGRLLGRTGGRTFLRNLTVCFAEMTMFHLFKNGGRPYAVGDVEHEKRFKVIVKEVESYRKKENLDEYINSAMTWKTSRARETLMIVAVPSMIAKYGPVEAKFRLRRQLPSLLNYYMQHVHGNLLC
ncbi:uncharacterized protein LOC124172919 [Ischnura elegans]|uniref:uncharacterized protein LOC124172919 n=1 Tax=Ischnura elegans TaxID=197161 RepID=UPI001ED89CA5|nr:uncharacterized protein LOC124172919 [Ischnura elegans]